jgi:adenylate cyclase
MTTFSTESVQAQLARILTSPDFVGRDKLGRFLGYVVEKALTDHPYKIKQHSIAVEALGYGPEFNPSTNPSIRILAQRVRRALERYYADGGAADPIRIEIPKGSYVPVYSKNPDITRNSGFASEPMIPGPSIIQAQDALPDGPSIAILPLEFLGKDSEHTYITDGITEEIVIALTRFPEFLVIGPLDRDTIRHRHSGPREIGREYQVRFLLDGTVRLRGESLRISAKLTDTRSGHQLWGDVYDYDIAIATVGQLEDEIVSQVVSQIADNFGVIPRTLAKEKLSHQDESISDYKAVLLFHHHVRTVTEKSLTEAVAALEQVVQRDPDHDLALALLGDLVASPYWLGYTDDQSGLDRAFDLAKKALALNPNLQPAHTTMAIVCYLTFQAAQCLAEIDKALYLNPNNANYIANSALFLVGLGEHERGYSLINKAMRLNPHHPGWYHYVAFTYHYFRGEYDAALVDARKFNTPEYFWDPLVRTAVYGQLDNRPEAEKAASELLSLVPDFEPRGHGLIQRMVFRNEHVDMIGAGLQKAGIKYSG